LAVVNESIVGNRLLRDTNIFGISALARFDRDALVLPGVTNIVLLEGINDIGFAGAKNGWANTLPMQLKHEVLRTS
jgi:hypothetical protein